MQAWERISCGVGVKIQVLPGGGDLRQLSSWENCKMTTLDRSAPFYVAGHKGLAGSAIWRHLEAEGFSNLIGRTSRELDLRERNAVFDFFRSERPAYVVLAAAKVGGIVANNTYPVDFISENLQVQVNVMDAALEAGVKRFLFLGSSCIYPKLAAQPIREDSLLTGYLEPTNDAYAIAKIAGILQVQAVRRQYGLPWISAMPTNLYGPNDNFSPTGSHVLPALIRRYQEAADANAASVTNWGTGAPRREFMHVDDLASAALFLLENYDGDEQVNVGTGVDVTIREIAETISSVVGFAGATEWDTTKPDGTPQKLLDISKISGLGWAPKHNLESGLASTVEWFRANRDDIRQ